MPPRLSARQEQCVRLTAFRTDKEIAAHLGISEATVKKHIHEACQRLGVNRRKAALAILEQNGPGYPINPMPEVAHAGSDTGFEGEETNGSIRSTAAALDVGRPGDGVRTDRLGPTGETAPRPSDPTTQARVRHDDAGRASGLAVEHGRARGPDPVRGYRPPPRGPLLRLILVAAGALLIASMLVAVGHMVSDLHQIVERLDGDERTAP
jgi:DNA-binding CsgD family transcriptional regulator